jgi:surface antigen
MKNTVLKQTAALSLSALLLTACAQDGSMGGLGSYSPNKSTIGGALGAVGGAVAGAQFGKGSGQLAAVAAGTLLGAYAGSELGASLDRADTMYAQRSAGYAFDTGNQASWRNPESGNYGTITPQRSYQSADGNTCREYSQNITVGGKAQKAYGTACKQPDGSWRIQN